MKYLLYELLMWEVLMCNRRNSHVSWLRSNQRMEEVGFLFCKYNCCYYLPTFCHYFTTFFLLLLCPQHDKFTRNHFPYFSEQEQCQFPLARYKNLIHNRLCFVPCHCVTWGIFPWGVSPINVTWLSSPRATWHLNIKHTDFHSLAKAMNRLFLSIIAVN